MELLGVSKAHTSGIRSVDVWVWAEKGKQEFPPIFMSPLHLRLLRTPEALYVIISIIIYSIKIKRDI